MHQQQVLIIHFIIFFKINLTINPFQRTIQMFWSCLQMCAHWLKISKRQIFISLNKSTLNLTWIAKTRSCSFLCMVAVQQKRTWFYFSVTRSNTSHSCFVMQRCLRRKFFFCNSWCFYYLQISKWPCLCCLMHSGMCLSFFLSVFYVAKGSTHSSLSS